MSRIVSFRELETCSETSVTIRARILTYRIGRSFSFVLLKGNNNKTIQAIVPLKLKSIFDISPESILLVSGVLQKTPEPVKSADYKHLELYVRDFEVYNVAHPLPYLVKDSETVDTQLRLSYPWLSHRSPYFQKIMRAKALFLKSCRNYLDNNEFIEFQTPKIIPNASESGAEVFKLNYFGKEACLAQSPQLYKQMLINSDYGRIYEIGPIFRAENSLTNRHLCEFTGLDFEMTLDSDFTEIIKMAWNMLYFVFNNLNGKFDTEVIIPKIPLMIHFKDGAKLLQERNVEQDPNGDISTPNEKLLGQIVKEKYGSDLFVLTNYPKSVRPFYTKECENDPIYTNSFDIILRGIEISSGAQRIDNPIELINNIESKGIDSRTLKEYIDSFHYGSWPHGGCGFGVERVIACYLNLNSIHMGSYCPRTPTRFEP